MRLRVTRVAGAAMGLVGCLAMVGLAGCGAGDSPGVERSGVLNVSAGGSGSVFFPSTQVTLPFSNSVTVAVRGVNDAANQFTIYTFFGLSRLTFTEVPQAVLVTFINGLDANVSSSTSLPSTVVGMVIHNGFNQNLGRSVGRILAQDAPITYELATNGVLILEPQAAASGSFVAQDSANREVRYATCSVENTDTGEEALVDGSAPYALSTNIGQSLLGYVGNLGLLLKPSGSGGGPPPPPGTTGNIVTGGGGTGGTGGTGGDQPPPVPLR